MFSKVLTHIVEQFPEYAASAKLQDAQIQYNQTLHDALVRIGERDEEAKAIRAFDEYIKDMQDKGLGDREVWVLKKAIKVFQAIENTTNWEYR